MTTTRTATTGADGAPPAWFPDPRHRHEYRYWDGTVWTDQVSDAGVVQTDPLVDSAVTDVRAVIDGFRSRLDATPVHFGPDLPAEQVRAAIEKYATGVDPTDVLVFVDSTLRHSGKAGFLLTPTTLYAHEVGSRTALPLSAIHTAELVGSSLQVNGTPVVANVFPEVSDTVAELLLAVGRCARGGEAQPVATPAGSSVGAAATPTPAAQPGETVEATPARASIGGALGQLGIAALLGIWPVLAFMTSSGEDCEQDGLALVCEGDGVETTFNLGIVGLLALFAVAALVRGIVQLVLALRPPPA